MSNTRSEYEGDVVADDDTSTKKPNPCNVILHNDDFTPMDFVVEILEQVFHHTSVKAVELMQEVHNKGRAIAGTYSFEIAETKVAETTSLARQNGYPLRCSIEHT